MMLRMRTRRNVGQGDRAFTLIELLVVIAIISLLVSILIPALNSAKEITKQVVCTTNVRQLVVGINMYASDFQGALVPDWAAPPSPDPRKGAWNYWKQQQAWDLMVSWREFIEPYTASERMHACPSSNPEIKHRTQKADRYPRGYHANGSHGLGGVQGPMASWELLQRYGQQPRSFDDIHQPLETMLIHEGMGEGTSGLVNHSLNIDPADSYQMGCLRRCFYIHPTGNVSFGFADGHAEAMTLPASAAPTNIWYFNDHRPLTEWSQWRQKLEMAQMLLGPPKR